VTNSLLGGAFMSRITTNIREQKGYSYSPFSSLTRELRFAGSRRFVVAADRGDVSRAATQVAASQRNPLITALPERYLSGGIMLRRLLATTILTSALTWAADLTGTWSGPMEMKREGETRPDSAHLVLTQKGEEITGTAGPNADKQMKITKGTFTGSDVYIEVAMPDKDAKLVLRLKLDGDKLVGELRGEGSDAPPITGNMTLTRAAS
jgi:hypothetical protein